LMNEVYKLLPLSQDSQVPIDISEFEYCPSCPGKIIMEFIEKPPTLCCPQCGKIF
jgi:hypothetical protein